MILDRLRSKTTLLRTLMSSPRLFVVGSRSRSCHWLEVIPILTVMSKGLAGALWNLVTLRSMLSVSGGRCSVVLGHTVFKRLSLGQVCVLFKCTVDWELSWDSLGLSPYLTAFEVFANPSRLARLLLGMRQFAVFDIHNLWYVQLLVYTGLNCSHTTLQPQERGG